MTNMRVCMCVCAFVCVCLCLCVCLWRGLGVIKIKLLKPFQKPLIHIFVLLKNIFLVVVAASIRRTHPWPIATVSSNMLFPDWFNPFKERGHKYVIGTFLTEHSNADVTINTAKLSSRTWT
uniref:Secreted protein n=1 Tax=Anguilla anguilla TaxID=7936 RepID=A0A0E9WYU6_ANGAN